MTQVNVTAVVHLTHLYLPGNDRARQRHEILIVASTAAFSGRCPTPPAYAATKSFDLHFAEGLAEEVRQYGVRVCALCPGSTGNGVFSGCGAAQPHATLARNRREGCTCGARGACGRKKFRDFRIHELAGRGNRADGPPRDGRANHRRNISSEGKASIGIRCRYAENDGRSKIIGTPASR